MGQPRVVLLGPQRLSPTLKATVDSLGLPKDGQLAAVTAGWEERELEDQEMREHVERELVNLKLYERAEDVFQRDKELHEGIVRRHDRMRSVQELYRIRLSHALEASRELLRERRNEEHEDLLELERAETIGAVRELDRSHLDKLTRVHEEFEDWWRPAERESVARHRSELAQILQNACALCVAGGHVLILLNRLRLFGLLGLVGDMPILSWSAGAMALSERVVVFHDSPPQGPGDPEVLEVGLGAFRGLVALPHAKRRLRLEDPTRVSLFARRFQPAVCANLDENTRLDWDGTYWVAESGTMALSEDGSLSNLGRN